MSCPLRVDVFRPDFSEMRALSTVCSELAVEEASLWPELRSSASSTPVLKQGPLCSELIYFFPGRFFSLDI